MLTQLFIKNFAIVDELEIIFDLGMSAITGETGAGKSIMLDALTLCLGARADSKAVRDGQTFCEIVAEFDVSNIPQATSWLQDRDLAHENICILRRIINDDSRSKSYINGTPTTLQQTRELGIMLINICSQHEHQSLLKTEIQRRLLDNYGQHQHLVEVVEQSYQVLFQTMNQLEQLQQRIVDSSHQALVQYQVQELNELALADNEVKQLEEEHKKLANAEQLIQQYQEAATLLDDNNSDSILNQLYELQNLLRNIRNTDTSIKSNNELIENIVIQTQEIAHEIKNHLEDLHLDPERYHYLDQRLQNIYQLARKHHIKPQELTQLHQQLQNELQQLSSSQEIIEELEIKIQQLKKEYQNVAAKLTKAREVASQKLSKEITEHLQQLNLSGSKFAVKLEAYQDDEPHSLGAEKIEFQVSTNLGQNLAPLNKIASGGELARISLAIQVVTAQQYATPTLIFDEVDVGIGGSTAEIVGHKLKQLAKAAQVIVVTHQAQVAAQADQHLQVEKIVDKKQIFTKINKLTRQQRIHEIARMIGGISITQQTLKHAEEIIDK